MLRFFNRLTIAGILFILFSIGIFIFTLRNVIILFTPAVDLYASTDWSELDEGTHVSTKLDFIYDYFYYVYDEDTNVEQSRAYMIPNLVEDESGIHIKEYVGVMVNLSEGYEPYDNAVDKSRDWWYMLDENAEFPEPSIELDGYLRKMKKDEKEFLVEYISEDFGISEQEAEAYVCPYMVMPYDSGNARSMMIISAALFGLGILFAGIGILIGLKR